ncbi:PAS domain-containing sensor histidine kinase [Aliarcobacter lanthieri]|uniref:PAS domain-containing sensor histidine kinase n=1 Tax=Aliarcobacter lanthieri TaxID=1355374 RepID=UPI003AAE949F
MKKINTFKDKSKFFILEVKHKIVVKTYGREGLDLLCGQRLKSIFRNNIYNKLKKLTKKVNNLTIIKWKKRKYEVYFKNNTFYFYDITSYSKIQSKLNKSLNELTSKKEELQAVFDLAANGISILDRNGKFLYANKFFQNMMEYSMEELYNESCISLSSDEYSKPSQTAVEQAIKYGSVKKFKKVCVTKSGTHINASMSLAYLKNQDEIVMITSDITEEIEYQDNLRKQIEIEVSKRAEQYEILFQQSRLAAMGEMINAIAHQWRQPLNSLGIIVQSLRHIISSNVINIDVLKEIESDIMEKLNYMSQTIDDFSTFFRITKEEEKFDILDSIKNAIRLIDIQLKSNKIEIEIENKLNSNLKVTGFLNEFRQVILNLIHNSMVAIVTNNIEKGKIIINIKEYKEHLQINVIDNGGGIEDENMPKIFDPYFSTKEKGNGIGLYMSKVIIENHMNGILKVKNIKGGVVFTIMLSKD